MDIMEKQGAALAERPLSIAAGELFTGGQAIAFASGERLRRMSACFPEELAKVMVEFDWQGYPDSLLSFIDSMLSLLQHRPSLTNNLFLVLWVGIFIVCPVPELDIVPTVEFPHRTTQDVIWETHCIPAGTTVFSKHWAIFRDPKVYPDPDAFKS
ncbi:hypothetical protein EDB19DRAFT_1907501 [Suillus lakei]|nr:hypothetical protein EDB19DRAFT_1907501 [Suillus lakei]